MSTQPRSDSPFSNRSLVIVALILAAIAFAGNFFYLNRMLQKQRSDAFEVLLAAADLPIDTRLDDADVQRVPVPGIFREGLSGVIKGIEFDQVKGSTIKRSVQKGQVLFWEYITGGAGDSPAKLINPRYRAVTVQIDAASTPVGLVRPGSFVDLVGSVQVDSSGPPESMTVLEYVRVVATGSVVQPEDPTDRRRTRVQSFRDITLELRPDDAVKLRAVESHMAGRKFIIHVRNPADDQVQWGKGAFNPRLANLLSGLGAATTTP